VQGYPLGGVGADFPKLADLWAKNPIFGPKISDFRKFPAAGTGIEEILEKEVVNDTLH